METETKKERDFTIKLDRKSKILFLILGIIIIGSVAVTFWRCIVKRDYIIQVQIDCDPETEKCFVWKCDPKSGEEGKSCTGNPDEDIWYYKTIRRNAKNIPDCDPKDENCTAYICGEDEKDCGYELCTPENVPDGEECNYPQTYLKENPPADEPECNPDNEECINNSSEEQCAPDDENCQDQTIQDENQNENDQNSPENNTDSQVSPEPM